jgi:hypothetical protein
MPQQRMRLKDCFYEELERVFNKFPKYHTEMLDFSVELGKEDIFKLAIGSESLLLISNDRVLNFAILKNRTVESTLYIATCENLLGHLLMKKPTIRLTIY